MNATIEHSGSRTVGRARLALGVGLMLVAGGLPTARALATPLADEPAVVVFSPLSSHADTARRAASADVALLRFLRPNVVVIRASTDRSDHQTRARLRAAGALVILPSAAIAACAPPSPLIASRGASL